MATLAWFLAAFLSGSLPFAVWLGRGLFQSDVRWFGDGNPGAANAWRMAGWRAGLPALLLDFLKGALPVWLARLSLDAPGRQPRQARAAAWRLPAISVAPLLGHAWSPFLRFRGGKALTVTFGIWSGLTLAGAPLALGASMAGWYSLLRSDGWSAVLSMGGLLGYLLLRRAPAPMLAVWAFNTLLLAFKHRAELSEPPQLRQAVLRRLRGAG